MVVYKAGSFMSISLSTANGLHIIRNA